MVVTDKFSTINLRWDAINILIILLMCSGNSQISRLNRCCDSIANENDVNKLKKFY